MVPQSAAINPAPTTSPGVTRIGGKAKAMHTDYPPADALRCFVRAVFTVASRPPACKAVLYLLRAALKSRCKSDTGALHIFVVVAGVRVYLPGSAVACHRPLHTGLFWSTRQTAPAVNSPALPLRTVRCCCWYTNPACPGSVVVLASAAGGHHTVAPCAACTRPVTLPCCARLRVLSPASWGRYIFLFLPSAETWATGFARLHVHLVGGRDVGTVRIRDRGGACRHRAEIEV